MKNLMVKEPISTSPEIPLKDYGKMEKNRDSEFSNTQTGPFMKDNIVTMSKTVSEK